LAHAVAITGCGSARRWWLRDRVRSRLREGGAAMTRAEKFRAKAAECDKKADEAKDAEAETPTTRSSRQLDEHGDPSRTIRRMV